MSVPRLNTNIFYRTDQEPPPRAHYPRQQIPPRPSYPVYDEHEHRYGPSRPPPRSRRSMDIPRSDPSYGPAALIDDMYSRRLPHRAASSLYSESSPPHPHPTYYHPPESHRLSFDSAAIHLFNELTTSRNFLGDLLDSFDREIAGVSAYVDAKIQEILWTRKIEKLDEERAKQHERLRYENEIATNPSSSPPPPPPAGHSIQTFCSTACHLVDALKMALDSTPSRTPPPPGFTPMRTAEERKEETESMKRLIKKLRGQFRDLCELIEGSKKSARKCGELIKDLGILLDVLNNSGNLWRQGGMEG